MIFPLFLIIFAISSIATLVVSEWGSLRIIDRGQTAGSAFQLAWDDALKGRAVNLLTIAPLYLGAFGSEVGSALSLPDFGRIAGSLAGSHSSEALRNHLLYMSGLLIEDGVGFVAILFVLIASLVDASAKPQQRYLRRLWPKLAAEVSEGNAERYRLEVAADKARTAQVGAANAVTDK